MCKKALLVLLLMFSGALSAAAPQLRVGPVEGLTETWRMLPGEIDLPVGTSVLLELNWGRNLADINIDGRVDLTDYATLAVCFGLGGGLQADACAPADYAASDLDGDGDVDQDDAVLFRTAHDDPRPFEVRQVTWAGAGEVSREGAASIAQLDLIEPGTHTVTVEALLYDPIADREVVVMRQCTIQGLDVPPVQLADAGWVQGPSQPREVVIQMQVDARSESGDPLWYMMPGDSVLFDIGLQVDPTAAHPQGNYGLSTIVYDVLADTSNPGFYLMNPMDDAWSGYAELPGGFPGPRRDVTDPLFVDSGTTYYPGYNGGWGFDTGGFPTGGDTTGSTGDILAAALMTPLVWTADVNPTYLGLQPYARQYVGHGTYTFPPEDPYAGGLTGGFGQDLSNRFDIVQGDGTWLLQRGIIDTSGWLIGTYHFDVVGTDGAVFNPLLDYSQDQPGGFRLEVLSDDIGSTGFTFTIGFPDCNGNGIPDDEDIAGGTSQDINDNGLPDECEDCNANGLPDDLDIAGGTSQDCNTNGIPDECETDCNGNAVPDDCDIRDGTSQDCNTNGVPDECETDCNGNGVPDDCDISGGTSQDCNTNGIPDECEPDCNANGVPDDCDIEAGTSEDCQPNGMPDECDLAAGASPDCNANLVPDECERDCNGNGVPDDCDLTGGTSLDCQPNGIPDECDIGTELIGQAAKLTASDVASGDHFGFRVAVCGDVALIGTDDDDDTGSAYVFRGSGSLWIQEQKLLPTDGASNDGFGSSVAISGDVIVVGARYDGTYGPSSGSAYVFRYDGSSWIQEQKLLPTDGAAYDYFGRYMTVSGDVAVIGADGDDDNGSASGSAYVFRYDGTSWIQEQKLLAADGAAYDHFGISVAVSGDLAMVGAYGDQDNGQGSGSAYVFRKVGSSWIQEQKLLAADGSPGDYFGRSVALSGNVAVIGASTDADNGYQSGSAYVFRYDGSSWLQQEKLLADDGRPYHYFGASVAVSRDLAVIGAAGDRDHGPASGAAYVFQRDDSSWIQEQKLVADDGTRLDEFGIYVAVSSAAIVVGSHQDDDNGSSSGSAYVFAIPSADCNDNGIPDECDIAEGTSEDCQPNGIPDECDIVAGTSLDCNGNGVPDDCDIAEGTSQDCNANGIPDECEAAVDIKPGACPNPFNRSSHGVLPVALLGATHFDVTDIDVATVGLARGDGVGQPVAPHEGPPGPHSVYDDVGTPLCGQTCDCHDAAGDGIVDLFMKFKSDDVVADLLLDELDPGALVELVVTGSLLDGTPFAAGDCIRLVPPGPPPGELVVTSIVPNVWIDSSPLDLQLDGGGFTDFQRTYPAGTVVTLTAPDSVNTRPFKRWVVDGALQPAGVKTIEVTIVESTISVELEVKWSSPNVPPRENLGPDRLMEP